MASSESTGAARRYAEAAFELAKEGDLLDQWHEDLTTLAAVADDPGALAVLDNPKQPLAGRIALLERAMSGLPPQALNLAKLLLTRGRFALLPQISDLYHRMLDRERNIVRAEVVTAVPLADDDREAIRERLRAMTGAADVRLDAEVDPAIIGGLVARVGDRLIDGSTRTRLVQLKRRLAGAAR